MDKIERKDFEAWVKPNNWLKINEVGNSNGQQVTYLTPAGEFVIAQYDLKGDLQQIVKPMPAPPQSGAMRRLSTGTQDFRGGGQFPGGPPG